MLRMILAAAAPVTLCVHDPEYIVAKLHACQTDMPMISD